MKVEEPKYKKDKHLNEKISLFRGDITKLEMDAIVNAGEWGLLAGRSQRPGCLVTFAVVCHAWHGGRHLAPAQARGARLDGLLAPQQPSVLAEPTPVPLKP